MQSNFKQEVVSVLSKKAENQGLKDPQEISQFVSQSIKLKYGTTKISVNEIASEVWRNVHYGVSEMPELPDVHKPLDLNSNEVNLKIIEVSTKIAEDFKSQGIKPKIEDMQARPTGQLKSRNDENTPVRLSDEISDIQLSKISTLTMAALDPNRTCKFEAEDGLKDSFEAIDKSVNPELY